MNRRKCLFCKEWFIPKESSRKFCSHDCSLKYKLTVRQSDTGTLLYRRYTDMKQRVNNPKSIRSNRYYERGISICKEWQESYIDFKEWALSHGYEDGLSLDRIDVDKGYCPENCRLVDTMVQNNNKTNSVRITINNETKTLAEWTKIYNIKYDLAYDRIKRGWDPFKALTECNQTKKRIRMLRYKDKEMKVTDWAKELGVSIRTISRYSQTPEDFVRFIERYNNIKEKK